MDITFLVFGLLLMIAFLQNMSIGTLLAIIICILVIGWLVFMKEDPVKIVTATVNKDKTPQIHTPLQEIVKGVAFTKPYDVEKYDKLLSMATSMELLYAHTLGERTKGAYEQALSDFQYQRKEALRIFYSMYLTTPSAFKKRLISNPDKVLEAAIGNFRDTTLTMLETLHRFCHDQKPTIPAVPDFVDVAPKDPLDVYEIP